MAGFESAYQINRRRKRIDMLAATQHDREAASDYALLKNFGITAVRDGIRWYCIQQPRGRYDFSSLAPMVEAACEQGTQVIWALCHYGWPDDLDVFSPAFVDQFAKYCSAVARFMAQYSDGIPFYTPINEISFLAWAAGHDGSFYPHETTRAWELKCQFIRAAVAAREAILAVQPKARFVHVDPLIHVLTPRDNPALADEAAAKHASQFQAWDMLSGRHCPELGGTEPMLDIMGVNFYHSNQWEYPDNRLRWEDTPRDERWIPLHKLLADIYQRYHRPLFIAETSHFGVGRGLWLREIAAEVVEARKIGVPLEGVCIYPILDRPDWEDPDHWHNSGLWDLVPENGNLRRVLNEEYAADLRWAQALVS